MGLVSVYNLLGRVKKLGFFEERGAVWTASLKIINVFLIGIVELQIGPKFGRHVLLDEV